jgi:hypothetical protein
VLRRIFRPKRDEVTGEWRRLHKKELYGLYHSLNIQVIKSRRMRWAGYVARMAVRGGAYTDLVGRLKAKGQLEDIDIDGRMILKMIFDN